MINTSLDRKCVAREGGQTSFEPAPEGDYTLKVKEIAPWRETKQDVKVIQRDEKGNAIKDDKGKNVTELVKDCVFYNSNIKFEIVGGEFDGKMVFHNITTHPNMNWSIDNFLYAINVKEMSASQIPTSCLNLRCNGHVYIDEYKKLVQNKETGIDEEQTRKVNRVKSLKPLNTPNTNNEVNVNNLGI